MQLQNYLGTISLVLSLFGATFVGANPSPCGHDNCKPKLDEPKKDEPKPDSPVCPTCAATEAPKCPEPIKCPEPAKCPEPLPGTNPSTPPNTFTNSTSSGGHPSSTGQGGVQVSVSVGLAGVLSTLASVGVTVGGGFINKDIKIEGDASAAGAFNVEAGADVAFSAAANLGFEVNVEAGAKVEVWQPSFQSLCDQTFGAGQVMVIASEEGGVGQKCPEKGNEAALDVNKEKILNPWLPACQAWCDKTWGKDKAKVLGPGKKCE